ncbi:hypothetical protein ACQVP2_15965 [Methylobacterium aquaticum]|uniref:hypothetical protein n=1 Tax=Methylobacterium aquaticum TaxID=270351 RepID=UPI003D16FE63
MRDLLRTREQFVREQASHVERIQKTGTASIDPGSDHGRKAAPTTHAKALVRQIERLGCVCAIKLVETVLFTDRWHPLSPGHVRPGIDRETGPAGRPGQ